MERHSDGREKQPAVRTGMEPSYVWHAGRLCMNVGHSREWIAKVAYRGKGRRHVVSMVLYPRHEGDLSFRNQIVDRNAGAFIQDFHPEDLGSRHGAVFVGGCQGDVEGKDLIRVPGCCQFGPAADRRNRHVIQLVDGATDGGAGVTNDGAVEQRGRILRVGVLELGTDFILIGNEQAAGLVEQVEQGVTIEVDPYREPAMPRLLRE